MRIGIINNGLEVIANLQFGLIQGNHFSLMGKKTIEKKFKINPEYDIPGNEQTLNLDFNREDSQL